jgi:hypothetical protein
MSNSNIILCIPGVFANIKEERIHRAFDDLDIGQVSRVDIVKPKQNVSNEKENKFNRVFVHICLNDSNNAIAVKERLSEGKDIKIIYDEPWYWKVSIYKPPVVSNIQPKKNQVKKAKLEFGVNNNPLPIAKGLDVKMKIAPALDVKIAPALDVKIAPALDITEDENKNKVNRKKRIIID